MAAVPTPSLHGPPDISVGFEDDEPTQQKNITNPDYSVGNGNASFEMAKYLDEIETTENAIDICSFQDVDLGCDDANGDGIGADRRSLEAAFARARKRYYLLPVITKYRLPIVGGAAFFVLLLVSIGLSASPVKRTTVDDGGTLHTPDASIVNDAPSHNSSSSYTRASPPTAAIDILDEFLSTTSGEPSAPKPPARLAAPPTPTPPISRLEPKWFRNTDIDWFGADHAYANAFCNKKDMKLCTYDHYCPNGKSHKPYGGGPEELFTGMKNEWEQWSPVAAKDGTVGTDWVQIGKFLDGGGDDDYNGRCWTYSDWSGLRDLPSDDPSQTRWVLCCDKLSL